MADIVVEAAMLSGTIRGMRGVVFVNSLVGYVFGINGDSDLDYMKTTDGGLTWGAGVDIFTGTVAAFDVWYDQWTPGDTGRIIHIAFIESGTDDVSYFAFNTVNDTKTGIVDIYAGTTAAGSRGVFTSITKARGGNLYCAFQIATTTEKGFYRSIDNGVTWEARADPMEISLDQALLFPANAADPQDIWLLYDDDSTTELTVKTYDDSANSHSESAALVFNNGSVDLTGQYGFSGSIRHQDGHLIFAFFNARDAAGEDFLCYSWDGTNLTALTALTTDIDDMYYPSVYLNQDQPDYIYVAYVGKSDGLETLDTTAGVYYALSKDRGVSWTKDIPYSTSVTDLRSAWAPLNGERFIVIFADISALSLNTNNDNSKEFGFTPLNNYQSVRATGYNNTGIMSVGERVR
jgi:hypothetical protein